MVGFRNWIPIHKIDYRHLSKNPHVIEYIEQNPEKINWRFLSHNPNAIHILEKNIEKIDWFSLFDNPNGISLIQKILYSEKKDKNYFNCINSEWTLLSKNPNGISILEKFPEKINWSWLSTNPNAIELLSINQEKIHWKNLSTNPNAIELLEKNFDKISWEEFSANPNAIKILEKYPEKIVWRGLSQNPNAIHLLEKNLFIQKDICLHKLVLNPNPDVIPLIYKKLEYNLELLDGYSKVDKLDRLHSEMFINIVKNVENPQIFCILEHLIDLFGFNLIEIKLSQFRQETHKQFWELLSENPNIFEEWNGMK